jgi:K+-sensing histidine kinase KdpD
VKFTKAGRVGLECTVGAGHVELGVFDTGPGISPEDQVRVFREFEQIKGSVGTGLGLPICANLAALLGGSLHVESEVGQGSRFVLRLPLEYHPAAAAAPPADDEAAAILPGDAARASTTPETVSDSSASRRGAVQVS